MPCPGSEGSCRITLLPWNTFLVKCPCVTPRKSLQTLGRGPGYVGNPAGNTYLARQERAGSRTREQERSSCPSSVPAGPAARRWKGMLFPILPCCFPPQPAMVFSLQGGREPVGTASPSPAHPSCRVSSRTHRRLQSRVEFDFQEKLNRAQSHN